MRTIFTPPYLLLAIGLLFSINLKAADLTPIKSSYTFIAQTAMNEAGAINNGDAVKCETNYDTYIKSVSSGSHNYATNKNSSTINGTSYLNCMQIKQGLGLKFQVSAPCKLIIYGSTYASATSKRHFTLGTTINGTDVATCEVGKAISTIDITDNFVNKPLYLNANSDLYLAGLVFYDFEVAKITLATNGYSTFSADYDYTFTGAKAYKAAYNSESSTVVTLREITGVVPAGTGVIFKGTEGDEVTITKSATPAETISDNALTGVTVNTIAFLAGTNYVLASKEKTTAFVQMADGKQVKDMIGKAYLNIPASEVSAQQTSLRIVADPTSVNVIEVAEKTEAAPIYNVAGQRVNSNMKGMLITGGKKYINK